jgi:hypothetical protein
VHVCLFVHRRVGVAQNVMYVNGSDPLVLVVLLRLRVLPNTNTTFLIITNDITVQGGDDITLGVSLATLILDDAWLSTVLLGSAAGATFLLTLPALPQILLQVTISLLCDVPLF